MYNYNASHYLHHTEYTLLYTLVVMSAFSLMYASAVHIAAATLYTVGTLPDVRV